MKRTVVDVSTGEVTFVELTPEEVQEVLNDVASAPKPVRVIDARRLRLSLLKLGKLDSVESAVKTAGREAQIEWEYAQYVYENNALVQYFINTLGLDIDEIFNTALTL